MLVLYIHVFSFFVENLPEPQCDLGPSTSGFPCKRTRLEYGLSKRVEVSLVRLPDYKISALRPPTPTQFYSEDDSQSSSDSNREQYDESSDSDHPSAKRSKAKKKKKFNNFGKHFYPKRHRPSGHRRGLAYLLDGGVRA